VASVITGPDPKMHNYATAWRYNSALCVCLLGVYRYKLSVCHVCVWPIYSTAT
jgi:hypothetical protein